MDQVWLCNPSVAIKFDVPFMPEPKEVTLPTTTQSLQKSSPDKLDILPTELLLQTLDHLDSNEFLDLYQASPSVRSRCDNRFWRFRFRHDFPYLYDLRHQACQLEYDGREVNWQMLYREMLGQSYPALLSSSTALGSMVPDKCAPGVASRRRIWKCVEQLWDLYQEQQAARHQQLNSRPRPRRL
jgi:hypothetical protein